MNDKHFAHIKAIVNKHDPLGLLSQGAPDDEYESEISQIYAGIDKCNTIKDAQELVYNIFKENFGKDAAGDTSFYYEIARSIFDKLKK